MIVLLGSNGSMGRRYQAILKSLGVSYTGFDIDDGLPWEAIKESDGVIIATPTHTHEKFVLGSEFFGVPILCEKPLSTNLKIVEKMLSIDAPLQMMAQYQQMDWKSYEGDTSYNYYHSGNDGLSWDCMILLGLARGLVSLKQNSPIWRCELNGRSLTLDEVQESYVWAVIDWLKYPEGDREWIRKAHSRAAAFPGGTVDVHTLDAMLPRNPSVYPANPLDSGDR